MEKTPEPRQQSQQVRKRWFRGSHVVSFLLGSLCVVALIIYWNGHDLQIRRANRALAEAYLPNLPWSSDLLAFSHEDLFWGDGYIVTFEAKPEMIRAWINRFPRAPGFDDAVVEKTGVIKYELTDFAWGNKSHGCVIIDENRRKVYVDLSLISCSL